MLKTNLKSKHPQYTLKKGSIFYYSRAVPGDISSYYSMNRNINYLIECLGDNHLYRFTYKDAAKFKGWLANKNLATSSIQRVFSGIKAVVSFMILEQGLRKPFCKSVYT